jgi:hypothetical protein
MTNEAPRPSLHFGRVRRREGRRSPPVALPSIALNNLRAGQDKLVALYAAA